jgi:hypothetical protein
VELARAHDVHEIWMNGEAANTPHLVESLLAIFGNASFKAGGDQCDLDTPPDAFTCLLGSGLAHDMSSQGATDIESYVQYRAVRTAFISPLLIDPPVTTVSLMPLKTESHDDDATHATSTGHDTTRHDDHDDDRHEQHEPITTPPNL